MRLPESQDRRAGTKRGAGRVNSALEKNLLTYIAAASAAGIGMLGGPQAADAEIVYTAANSAVSPSVALDLNHDGIMDYNIVKWGSASVGGSLHVSYLKVCHAPLLNLSHQCHSSQIYPDDKNVVREAASGAMALPFGAPIGPGQPFKGTDVAVLMGARNFYSGSNTAQKWDGPWADGGAGVTNRYLGLKFQIDGKWHFGWARLTFKTTANSGFSATVTGYAYETIPNKQIRAGQTTETAETGSMAPTQPVVAPAAAQAPSLGSLALGALGLSIWRRDVGSLN